MNRYANLIRWHQDIKPENILVFSCEEGSVYDYCLKLADLGLSHFRRAVRDVDVTDADNYGTRAYGKSLPAS